MSFKLFPKMKEHIHVKIFASGETSLLKEKKKQPSGQLDNSFYFTVFGS